MMKAVPAFLAILCVASQASAQRNVPDWETKAGGKMSFEVASIHPSEPGKFTPPNFALDASEGYDTPPGGLFKAGFSLRTYIEFAYKLMLSKDQRDAMLANQPKWVSSENFVIEARAAGNPTKDQMRLMMQSLLADRFHLQVNFEKREMPLLALTLIKPGKTGPGLRPHSEGPPCDAPYSPPVNGAALDSKMYPAICNSFAANDLPGNTVLTGARDTTMNLVASNLSMIGRLDRTVVDQTGIVERVDFKMQWTMGENTLPPNPDAPQSTTFIEAVKEQLGIQLKSTRAVIETPVIIHVELPTEN
jgi:bla regulator protein blaR1